MSDERQHEDLARRLRDEGISPAPPDLRGEVMAQVAAEPRRKPGAARRWWRPAIAVAAVACGVIGLVVGLSNVGGTSNSSLSASAGASSVAADAAPAPSQRAPSTFSIQASDARRALVLGSVQAHGEAIGSAGQTASARAGHTYNLYVLADRYAAVSRKLHALERRASPTFGKAPQKQVRIILHQRRN